MPELTTKQSQQYTAFRLFHSILLDMFVKRSGMHQRVEGDSHRLFPITLRCSAPRNQLDALDLLTCDLSYHPHCAVLIVLSSLCCPTWKTTRHTSDHRPCLQLIREQRRSSPTSEQIQHLSPHPNLPIFRDSLFDIRNFARLHEEALSISSHS
jgi:hypothetical protein